MGARVPTTDVTRLDTSSAVDVVNQNFKRLSDAFDSVLLRGSDSFTGSIDAGGYRLFNLS